MEDGVLQRQGGELLSSSKLPEFNAKGVPRIRQKLLNALSNKKLVFPADGPPVPILNDLVRTRIPCLYVDGVEFLAQRLVEAAQSVGAEPQHTREGRLDGYFAQHVLFREDVFFRFAGSNEPVRITCEVQVASLLATRMWREGHPFYELARVGKDDPEKWQWDPTDPKFLRRQLGHMIHLADGLLVRLRDIGRPTPDTKGPRDEY
jgi:hypothetical protein